MLEKIAEMLGASPTQYNHLLKTERLVTKRSLQGKRFVNLSLGLTCGICFFISISVAVMAIAPVDVFTYALMGITMSMMIVGLWTIPYFDMLLSPTDYPVVAHTPVSSRTYFLVKLTQVLTYTALLLISSNLLPAISGIWLRGEGASNFQFLFPVAYLPVAFMSGFFTIGVMTTLAGYLTKFYTKKGLRNIAQYAQFIFPALFPLLWILLANVLPRWLSEDLGDFSIDKLISVLKWFFVLPNGWFAGTVSLALGQIERNFLILAGLAIVSTLFLMLVPLRNIAKSYSEYLSYLLGSESQQKSELKVKTPLFAGMFRNNAIRAGFCLGAAYLYRDKRILRQLVSMVGAIIVMVVVFTQSDTFSLKWIQDSYAIGLSPGFSTMFCFIGTGFAGGFLLPVKYSEHWKASWMLTLAPLAAPRDLWRGVQATTLVYIVAPVTLIMSCIATILWGISGIFYVLPGLTALLYYVIFYPKPVSGLPLSAEFIQKQAAAGAWIPFVFSIFGIGIFIVIQYLIYLLNIWVYYGFYCVAVVSGFIGFIYFLRKK